VKHPGIQPFSHIKRGPLPMRKLAHPSGYSLMEMLVTVAVTAILVAAIAVPAMKTLDSSRTSGCQNIKDMISTAKTSWCSDNPAKYQLIKQGSLSATVADSEILAYIPGGKWPACPSKGHYSNRTVVGASVTCDVHATSP